MLGASVQRGLRRQGHAVDWVTRTERPPSSRWPASPTTSSCSTSGCRGKGGLEVLRDPGAAAARRRCWSSPRRTPSPTAWPGSTPGPTTTWRSPSTSTSSRRGSGRCSGVAAAGRSRSSSTGRLVARSGRARGPPRRRPGRRSPRGSSRCSTPLLEHPGRPLSRARLEERLYGWAEEVESNAVEVHVHALRRSSAPESIKTLRGVGYVVPRKP